MRSAICMKIFIAFATFMIFFLAFRYAITQYSNKFYKNYLQKGLKMFIISYFKGNLCNILF